MTSNELRDRFVRAMQQKGHDVYDVTCEKDGRKDHVIKFSIPLPESDVPFKGTSVFWKALIHQDMIKHIDYSVRYYGAMYKKRLLKMQSKPVVSEPIAA